MDGLENGQTAESDDVVATSVHCLLKNKEANDDFTTSLVLTFLRGWLLCFFMKKAFTVNKHILATMKFKRDI